ncbi:MAG: RDD family protein, partial [Gammaproteobacteria bacterium]
LWRRLAAALYDSLLVLALLMLGTAALLPLTGGEALYFDNVWIETAFRLYLLALAFLFFGWFWTHGGQTLGMRAWKIRVLREDGRPLHWPDALRRFLWALAGWLPAGLGVFWCLFDAHDRTFQDRMSHTRLVRVIHG